MTEEFDLIVIGAGPAGEKGAIKAAQYGKRFALIERAPYLGGAGINTGTVPSKTLRESALYFSGLRQRGPHFQQEYNEKLAPFVPLDVYAIPEVSAVGMTEDDCQAKDVPYLVGRAYYEENARGQIIGDMSGMIKLIFSPTDKKLLGAHIIGEQASELIHIASHVMLAGGPIDAFIDAVYNYPTLSDSYQYAAYDGLEQLAKWVEANKK